MCELIWQSEKLRSRSSRGSYVDSKAGQLGGRAPSYHRDSSLTQTSTLTPTSRQGDMNPRACLLDIHGHCYIETCIVNSVAWILRGRRSRLRTLHVSQLQYCLFPWGMSLDFTTHDCATRAVPNCDSARTTCRAAISTLAEGIHRQHQEGRKAYQI